MQIGRISALVVALCALLPATNGLASHGSDTGTLSTRWVRPGFAEGWKVRTADVDGDGTREILYGGRKVAVLDPDSVASGLPRTSVRWEHEASDQVDGGDNVWVTGIEAVGDALYVSSSDTDAYALDRQTGAKRWHNPRTGHGLSEGFAVVDAPGDSIPDLFPTGGSEAFSGANGQRLWDSGIPRAGKFAVTAEVNGQPGRDAFVATNPSGVAIAQDTVFAVSGAGTIVGRFSPNSVVESLAAGDVDGDGVDEAIVGTGTGWLYAVGANGTPKWIAFPGPGRVEPVAALDIDGDAADEVVAGYRLPSQDDPAHVVLAYDHMGAPLWQHLIGIPISTLEPMQLDGDASTELVVGAGTRLSLTRSGLAVALDTAPTDVDRERWRVEAHEQVMSAAPYTQGSQKLVLLGAADEILRAVDATTGTEAWRYSAGGYVYGTDAGDLDDDGRDEVAKAGDDGVLVVVDGQTGRQRWFRRLDVGNLGLVRSVVIEDADGDRRSEIVAGATRFDQELAGVVELYRADGTRKWSTLVGGSVEDVEVADLDGDGKAEVVAAEAVGLDTDCAVNAFDTATGALRWRTLVSGCLVPTIEVGNIDGDPTAEVIYGDRTLASQPHIALLEHDGTLTWKQGIPEQVFWIEPLEDGFLHGGFTFGQQGSVARRTSDGQQRWMTKLPDDDDYGSASRFGTLVPREDGALDIAASADDGAVYLLSADDGAIRWDRRLEPRDLRFQDRHPAGPIVFVPDSDQRPDRLVVGQYTTGRRRAEAFALTLGGQIVGSAPMEGEAQAAALVRNGQGAPTVAVGAGLGLYVFDACAGCEAG